MAVPQLCGTALGEWDAVIGVPISGVEHAVADAAATTAAEIEGDPLRRGKAAGHWRVR